MRPAKQGFCWGHLRRIKVITKNGLTAKIGLVNFFGDQLGVGKEEGYRSAQARWTKARSSALTEMQLGLLRLLQNGSKDQIS